MPSKDVEKKWKTGKLRMGGTGKIVPKNRPDIMYAIQKSEERNEAAHGGEYVSGGERHNPLKGTRRPRPCKE